MKCLIKDLEIKWGLLKNTFKPCPRGISCNQSPHCRMYVISSQGVHSEAVDSLGVVVDRQCVRLCFIRHPTSPLEGISPLYYGWATALVQGKATLHEFSLEISNDPQSASTRDKINVANRFVIER